MPELPDLQIIRECLTPRLTDVTLVINPMLAGRIRYGEPLPRPRIATHFCRACQPGLMVNRR